MEGLLWFVGGALAGAILVTIVVRVGRQGRSSPAAHAAAQPGAARPATGAPLDPAGGQGGGGRSSAEASGTGFVATLPIGVVHLDADLRVTYGNPAAIGILGADAIAPGRTAMEAFLDAHVESMARDTLGGAAGAMEIPWGDGSARHLVLRSRRSTSGGVWILVEDVTELRRLQQIRAEFVENLSHELRTPLTTISLLAETLAREAQAPDSSVGSRMRDRIAKIEVETGHLVQMVTELLDLSRIESGPALVLHDDVDLGRLARASVERLRLFAERQDVRLAVDVDPSVPLVRGDEDRLGQVIVNLLHNAVKFSPDGGLVTVRVADAWAEVVVSVEDHGMGIPRSDQPRIFERFYKVDRARVRGGGTGLGLAIARHVVEAHGGRIWVESEPRVGSTFSFAIPALGSHGGRPGPRPGSAGSSATTP